MKETKKESIFACFGTANTSDCCAQCPDNKTCVTETIKRWKDGKVKIFCHSCEGQKFIIEKAYPTEEKVRTVCPECNGEGWVWDDVFKGES